MAAEVRSPRSRTGVGAALQDDEPLIQSAQLVSTVDALQSGKLAVSEYLARVCGRAERVDQHIRALLSEPRRRTRLHAEALGVAERWPDPGTRPPLYGIPVGVKDLFAIDGLLTRAGSRLPSGLFQGPQASIVSVLREAGAVILGKTAMDEFAYCEPPLTRNPHNPAHTPGGSSSGSAAAVAAGLCPLALGTQTTRSVIGPAAFCGVVGFKPSFGRIATDGIVPMAPSFDTIGFFAQDVPGALLAAAVLVPGWHPVPPERRPVLGVPDGFFLSWTLPEGRRAFEVHVDQLARAGYEIRRVQFFSEGELMEMDRQAIRLLHGELARVHTNWFRRYQVRYRPRTARGIRLGQSVNDEELAGYRAGGLTFRVQTEALMQASGIDVWVTPASAGPAPVGLDLTGWGGMTTGWSYAGLPCVTVPADRHSDRLPLGLQCVARFGHDEMLLSWAEDIARAATSE